MPLDSYPYRSKTASLKERMLNFIERIPESGCWIFTGSTSPQGYGRFSIGRGVTAQAHRVSYEMFVGKIDEGMFVHHKCYVRCCVNPAHLAQATNTENTVDAFRGSVKGHFCRNGHSMLDEKNWRFESGGKWRTCLACRRLAWKRKSDKRVAARHARGLKINRRPK